VPTVELRFSALPEHVRTARLVAVSLARRAGVAEETLDEVRLAVGEAATRAVRRHLESCPAEPVLVRILDDDSRFVAQVVDVATDLEAHDEALDPDLSGHATAEPEPGDGLLRGSGQLDASLPPGLDLAVIGGLVDDLHVSVGSEGSIVSMGWPATAPAASVQAG
jgi:anti-sigma regulatory factor (Ser/Thr protein kinase)